MNESEPVTGGRRWLAFAALCLSVVIVSIDASILNVALPTLVREVGASTSQLQWIVDSYVVVFAGLLLVMGSVGDRFGRKGLLSLGLVVFGLASFSAALATKPSQLIVCRAVMGVGGAMIMPATLSILANVFTEPYERRRAIAYWSMMNATGTTIGPIAGGLLLKHFWWGSVFLVNVPIVIIALIAGRFFVPTSRNPTAGRLDIPGAGLSTAGLSILLFAIIAGPDRGWTSAATIGTVGVAIVVLASFVIWELRAKEPMLQIRFFGDMRLTAASASIAIAFIALTGMMFLVAQLLQFVNGYSPLEAAMRVALPLLTINFIIMPLTPRIVERFGLKRVVAFGLTTVSLGLLIVSFTTVDSPYFRLLAGFALMATGFSLFLPSATDAIMGTVPREYAGSGSAINQTSRQAGQALGIAIGGSIAASGFRARLSDAPSEGPVSGDLLERARESIAGSYRIADELDGRLREQFIDLANSAFVHGFRISITVSAVTAIIGAVFAFVTLPGHLPAHERDAAPRKPSDASSVVEAEHADDRAVESHPTR